MKISLIRQTLINYLQVANDKKINAIFTLLEKEIKEVELISKDLLKNQVENDVTKLSWSNYITQEEMQECYRKSIS